MAQREIKFRGWDSANKQMIPHHNLNVGIKNINRGNNHITLLQYTGIKDLSGNEIYDGDIIEYPNGLIYIVEWLRNYGGMWLRENRIYENGPHGMAFNETEPYELQIVGNIYQTPELLSHAPQG